MPPSPLCLLEHNTKVDFAIASDTSRLDSPWNHCLPIVARLGAHPSHKPGQPSSVHPLSLRLKVHVLQRNKNSCILSFTSRNLNLSLISFSVLSCLLLIVQEDRIASNNQRRELFVINILRSAIPARCRHPSPQG
jgi:hypothetical protein